MRPINLLPPEAFERLQSRRLLWRVLLLGLAYIVLLALLTVLWSGRVGDADSQLEDQLATNEELRRELLELQPVNDLVQRYEENAEMVATALANDVAWGRVLNDLGRMIPDRVWLDGFSGATEPDESASIGMVQATGFGFDYPDVSAWLRSLDSDRFPGTGGTWVTSVGNTLIGETTVVQFVSQSNLTRNALSNRAGDRIPVVGG
jgi:Tfp pilus assembly protein PilN